MPGFPRLADPLSDDRVVLRDAAERDIPEVLIAYQDDPELYMRMGEERPPSASELGRNAESEPGERAGGARVSVTILEPGSDVCRGQINVHHVDWEHARAELGIWLAPQVRGNGMARGALRLVSEWLLKTCQLERVEILTEPDNTPMLRAATAAGFTLEGVLRAYLRERGQRVDAAILSRLPGDLEW
jgi:RimJ/RimL family protein N-acetyltransferase